MIQTISFTAMAEWVLGSFVAGMAVGVSISLYLFFRTSSKKSPKE